MTMPGAVSRPLHDCMSDTDLNGKPKHGENHAANNTEIAEPKTEGRPGYNLQSNVNKCVVPKGEGSPETRYGDGRQ
jgi:hypothetical protein